MLRKATLLGLLGLALSRCIYAAPDPAEILRNSDLARGGGLPGIQWQVQLRAVDGDKVVEQGLTVKAVPDNSLAEFFAPPNIADQKLLMVGRNMWFIRSGLRRPVPISPRQRLLGQASNGDVAATNYAGDYEGKLLGIEEIEGQEVYKLELTARNDAVTYPRILYWVSVERGLGMKAEFYTVSGRVFKAARFEYDNAIEYQGAHIPFVSRMVIQDQVNPGRETTLTYSDVEAVRLPRRTFNVNFLIR